MDASPRSMHACIYAHLAHDGLRARFEWVRRRRYAAATLHCRHTCMAQILKCGPPTAHVSGPKIRLAAPNPDGRAAHANPLWPKSLPAAAPRQCPVPPPASHRTHALYTLKSTTVRLHAACTPPSRSVPPRPGPAGRRRASRTPRHAAGVPLAQACRHTRAPCPRTRTPRPVHFAHPALFSA